MPAPSTPRQGAFISYARADGQAAAFALLSRLQADAPDVPAWLDRQQMEGGVGWWAQIEQALDRAEFLIVLMTPAAMRSVHTRQEWRAARQRGVCVYPVMGVPADELDFNELPAWMRKRHAYDPAHEWPTLLAHLRRGCEATRVPFMAPPLPAHHVPRPRETEALLGLLLQPETDAPVAITTALRGAGGFGKTTLAAALCHHDRCIEHFDDGILWVTLGQAPNLLNELIKLHAALTGERPGFVDVEDAARELAQRLANRHCLLVIDNAWSAAHVRPFVQAAAAGGNACLITTRLFEVALDARRVDVDRMTDAEGLQLLRARLGLAETAAASAAEDEALRRLVAQLGEWPLPIKLAASAMRQRIERGDTLANALAYVDKALARRGITAFDNTQEAVQATVGASLGLLDDASRQRCAELSIFTPQEAIPLASAAALWRGRAGLDELDSEDLARRLDDLALVEFDLQRGVLRLHDVLRGYLAGLLADAAAAHAALLQAWGDPYRLPGPQAWRTLARHLHGAGQVDTLRALLRDARWLRAKLAATHVHALLADFAHAGDDRTLQLLRDALRLAAPALAADPSQLGTQLCGRLMQRDEPALAALRAAFEAEAADGLPLQLLHPTLDAPGGPLTMTLVGHEREVSALALGGGGTRLLSASRDATLRLWDLHGGEVLATLEGLGLGARAAALDAAGGTALAGAGDGRLYLWHPARGEGATRIATERHAAINALALSADGRRAVSANGREHHLRVWDLPSQRCERLLVGHEEEVNAVAMSADGTRAVSGGDDGTLRLWDLDSGRLLHTLGGHRGTVNAVAMSADGTRVISGGTDRVLRWWDAERGTPLAAMSSHGNTITAVALAASGTRALSGCADQAVRVWELPQGRLLARLEGHGDAVRALAVDDAGLLAASGSADRSIKLWRLDDLRPQAAPPAHEASVVSLVFSPDGTLCASGSAEGAIQVLDVASGRLLHQRRSHLLQVRSLAFTPDGGCVLSGGVEGKYYQWPVGAAEASWIPIQHAPIVTCAMSASARFLLMSCGDRRVYLWDVPSGALVASFSVRRLMEAVPGTAGRDYDLSFVRLTPDGRRAVFGATLRVRESLRAAPAPEAPPSALLVLDIDAGELKALPLAHAEAPSAFAVDASGARALVARADHALELWDITHEQRLALLRGHTERVNAVALCADGEHALSASRDRSLRLWHLASGRQVAAFTADAALRSLALSPAGPLVATGDVSGRVHLLRWGGAHLLPAANAALV